MYLFSPAMSAHASFCGAFSHETVSAILVLIVLTRRNRCPVEVIALGGDSEGARHTSSRTPKIPAKSLASKLTSLRSSAAEWVAPPVFIQNQWDGLLPGLQRGNYMILLKRP